MLQKNIHSYDDCKFNRNFGGGIASIPASTAGFISGKYCGTILGSEIGGWVGGTIYDYWY